MKRLIVILIFLSVMSIAALALLALPPAEHVWIIGDAAKSQERSFKDWFHSICSGEMAIRVTGNLNEPSTLNTPLGSINLPKGNFDFIAFEPEAWSSSATFRYSPIQDTKGNVRLKVCLGSNPDWVKRPPPDALPTLYTGGWTAYYTGTDKKAWQGFFHHGQKWGEFFFWDKAGNIIKKEAWENGEKKNGYTEMGSK